MTPSWFVVPKPWTQWNESGLGRSGPFRVRFGTAQRGLCEFCRSCPELTGHDFSIDHVVPRSSGGLSLLQNLCWCCFWCNNFKRARTQAVDPKTSNLFPLFNPRADEWEAHFQVELLRRNATNRSHPNR